MVHLQKTAGTTLRDRFRSTFRNEAIYPNASDGPALHSVISLSHLLERWRERHDELRLIAGHFPLSTVKLLDASFITLSVLRPTVDRTLSFLRHQKRINTADRDKTLEQIYEDPFRFDGLVRNHMTRMFSIGTDEMRAGDGALTSIDDSDERLEGAKKGIASLDAFGLQPRFEEFWKDLSARYGLDATADVSSNTTPDVSSNATPDEDAPDALIERIVHDNALDIELYDFAVELYDGRRVSR